MKRLLNISGLIRGLLLMGMLISSQYSWAQFKTYSDSALVVEVLIKNPCDGADNGSIRFELISAAGGAATIFGIGGPEILPATGIMVGDTLLFDNQPLPPNPVGLPMGDYHFFIIDSLNLNTINTLVPADPVTLTDLTPIMINLDNLVNNMDCAAPNGSIDISISSGGSGSFSYDWTGPGPFAATTQDISGLAGGQYIVTVSDSFSVCFAMDTFNITDPLPDTFNIIAPASPDTVCIGDPVTISLDSSENLVNYEILVNGVGSGAFTIGDGNPINIVIGAGLFGDTDTLTVEATFAACTPILMNGLVIVRINPPPVANAGMDDTVCMNSTNLAALGPGMNESGIWTVLSGTGVFADSSDSATLVSGLSVGLNEFIWTISDDLGICPADLDTVGIFFLSLTPPMAGLDDSLCLDSAMLMANAPGPMETGTWNIVSGGGLFNDPNDPNTVVAGLAVGLNQFEWEISDNTGNCPPLKDTVDIFRESITVADAGIDDTICVDNTTLAGNSPGTNESGFWRLLSGSVVFADSTDSATMVSGLSVGLNEFIWTLRDDLGICSDTRDTVGIFFIDLIIANAGLDDTVCVDSTMLMANAPGLLQQGVWSVTSGTGSFVDTTDQNTIVNGLSVGLNQFTWTITDTTGNCGMTSDLVDIFRDSLTVADAGLDDTVCVDNTVLAGNAPGANESGFWQVLSGTGTFVDSTMAGTAVSALSVGLNEFIWTIIDDFGNCPPTQDTVGIFYINLTTANAGLDDTVCVDSAMLMANAPGAFERGVWSVTMGTGTFVDTTDQNTVVNGLSVGVNEFAWTIIDTTGNCGMSSDLVRITRDSLTVADAGLDDTVCVDNTVLAGNAPGANESGFWQVLSGTGTFVDSTMAGTAVSALSAGLNEFIWTIIDDFGNCPPTQDTVGIFYINLTTANAGLDDTVCVDSAMLMANAPGAFERGVWSVTMGTGTFVDTTDQNTVVNGLSVGVNEFAWTIIDTTGNCGMSSDLVRITRDSLTVADAGLDDTVCVDNTVLAGNAPGANESGFWQVLSGTGTFVDSTMAGTAVSALSAGLNEFIWTIIDDFGNCPPTQDTVGIFYINLTTANAGLDDTVCVDSAMLMANAPGAFERGVWSVTMGTGTFVDTTDQNTVVNGLSVGVNEFAWTIIDTTGNCGMSSDLVRITRDSLTVADAGLDDTVCVDNTVLAGNAPGANESGFWQVLSGTGTFVDSTMAGTAVSALSAGLNEFIWTLFDDFGNCNPSQDTVSIVFIDPTPANAGMDQSICTTSSFLTGNIPGPFQTGIWTVLSGPGILADSTNPGTLVSSLAAGLNEFIWAITDTTGNCGSSQDTLAINIIGSLTFALAGPNDTLCIDSTVLAANAFGPGELGTWSVFSGGGVFADPNDSTTTVSGLSVGTNELLWTISDTTGFCPPSVDTVIILYLDVVSSAGPDQNICATTATLAGNVPGAIQSGTWTVLSGAGSFTDPNDPNTMVTGVGLGTNQFIWTVSDTSGNCPSGLDTVDINRVGTLTVADAGLDNSVCLSSTVLSGNLPAPSETGTWSLISGTGIFVDPNNPTTILNGLSLGLNEFQWSITDTSGICPPSIDTVGVTLLPPTDPLCIGMGGGCAVFTVSIDTATFILPTCDDLNRGAVTFQVSGGSGGYTFTLLDSMGFSQAFIGPGPFSFSGLSAANYYYSIDDGAGNVCTLPFAIDLESTVQASASNFNDVVCFGTPTGGAVINATNFSGGFVEYSYDNGAIWFSVVPGSSVNNLPPNGSYLILVRDDSLDVCPDTVGVTINNVGPGPDPFSAEITDTLISAPDHGSGSITLSNITGGLLPYESRIDLVNPAFQGQSFFIDWSEVDFDVSAMAYEVVYEGLFAGDYLVEVRDSLGCMLTFNVPIGVDLSLFIPNIFTPNNDGVNDVFFIRNLSENAILTISNRWGKLIFESKNYQNDWDGGDNSDGVFFYHLSLNSGEDFSGWIEISTGSQP